MSLNFELITDGHADGDGYFDLAVSALKEHIDIALSDNQITQEQVGAIYTGVLPGLFKDAMSFVITDEQIRLGKIPSTLR